MKDIIPKTETPGNVYALLLLIIIVFVILLNFLIGFFGLILLFIVLAFTTSLYTESKVPAFHALILVNSFTGEMRTLFPGLNLKLPWEKAQKNGKNEKKYIDLRVDLKEVCEETYASQDAKMEIKYVYTIRPDISGNDPGRKILIFSSFEPDAIKSKGRALFSMLLSDHYGKNEGIKLLDKSLINTTVFGTKQDPKKLIVDFETEHAVEVTIRLEDSDFDAKTQGYRDTISGAKSIDDAIKILVTGGMDQKEAEKFVKNLNLPGYTETDFNLNIVAPDLKNLQNVSILGGGLGGANKKGGK